MRRILAALPHSLRKASGFPMRSIPCEAAPRGIASEEFGVARKAGGCPQGERQSRWEGRSGYSKEWGSSRWNDTYRSYGTDGFRIVFFVALYLCATNLFGRTSATPTEITVALDGSGQFKTVQEAIMSVPAGTPDSPVVIRIRPGVYKELIYIQHEKRFFRLIGEDAKTTILTYDLHANLIGKDNKPIGTFRTPSTVIDADDFLAENITFENSAGPVGQALAIRVDGDRAVFRRCRFLGWQDTVFLNRGRQYFEDCYIAGHVDFIFGAATAFFQHCQIHCLKTGYITAASTYDYDPYGFVFSACKITGEPNAKTYLGRPWRDYSNAIYLNTEMSDVVRPEGWQNWNLPAREKTARYSEYNSTGAGANSKARVSWSKQLTKAQAKRITVKTVLSGTDGWDPLKVVVAKEAKISNH